MLDPITRTIITRYGKVISGDRDEFQELEDYILYKEWPWFWRTDRIYKDTIAEDRQTLNFKPFFLVLGLTFIIGLAAWGILANLEFGQYINVPTDIDREESYLTGIEKTVLFGPTDSSIGSDSYDCTLNAKSTLRKDDYGELVYLAQGLLGNYYKHTPDGVFGPKMLIAVKNFQNTHGLTADGIIGPVTWRLLEKSCSVDI